MTMHTIPDKTALFIIGPTGVGKTYISICVSEEMNGEIISADSRQFYRYMDIGTDKPSKETLERIPHHFINILNPDEYYNAGQFGKDARVKISEIRNRNRLPVIAGGSGLYVKAILEGFFDEKKKDLLLKRSLTERAEIEGNEALYAELQSVDPEFAAQISMNDTQRIVRGLEVFKVTGIPLTTHWRKQKVSIGFEPVTIGLRRTREELYEKINRRVETMLERGLVEEVRSLRTKGYSPELNAFKTYGYAEVFRYLENIIPYDEMVEQIQRRTRNFAKRQMTWFRKMENVTWIDIEGNDRTAVTENIYAIINDRK